MSNRVPMFTDAAIHALLMKLYGIQGEISPLVSFEDQNACVKTPEQNYVLKFANTRWPIEGLHMQTEVLERLAQRAPDICVPQVVKTLQGDTVTFEDGFAVRLLTYLEGDIFCKVPRTEALYSSLGHFMGRFTTAMDGYAHPAAHRDTDLWNLDNVLACKQYLPDIIDPDIRACIGRYFDRYENHIALKHQQLRKAVIHNDANEQNILASTDGSSKIVGLIDFGDMAYASLINELAITLAYTLLDEENLEMAARAAVQAFRKEFALLPEELEILFDLVAMRLVQSVTISSNRFKEFPDNEYIIISQKPACELLIKLEEMFTETGAYISL